jgi:hypothetical protein
VPEDLSSPNDDGVTVWRLTADARRVQEEEITAALQEAGPSFGRAKIALEDCAKGADPIVLMGAIAMYIPGGQEDRQDA